MAVMEAIYAWTHRLFTLTLVLVLAGCDSGPSQPVGGQEIGSLSIPEDATLAVGQKKVLTWQYRNARGDVLPSVPSWSSADPTIVSVDELGVATGLKVGSSAVTARFNGSEATSTITVTAPPHTVKSLSLHPDSARIIVGTTFPLFARAPGFAARTRDWLPGELAWSSNAPDVATVDPMGFVLGISVGSTAIAVSAGGLADTVRITVDPPFQAAQISVGGAHVCAVTVTGEAVCWGDGDYGAVGQRTAEQYCNQYGCKRLPARSPLPVGGEAEFRSLATAAGSSYSSYSCGIASGGETLCWGGNAHGELGVVLPWGGEMCAAGTSLSVKCSSRPLPADLPEALQQVSAGSRFACGLTSDGRLYCWGDYPNSSTDGLRNEWGLMPSLVKTDERFVSLSAGAGHTCALAADGASFCWGGSPWGQLGADPPAEAGLGVPTRVFGGLHFSTIAAGELVTCGLTTEGRAHCWGNRRPELADGAAASREANLSFTSMAVAENHACGVADSGAAYCWGSNGEGQLGIGMELGPEPSRVPLRVAGGHSWRSVGVGWRHTCGLTMEGVVYCWGSNMVGQLGIGTAAGSRLEPTRVVGQAR